MASNEKEHRHSLGTPLLSYSLKGGRSIYALNIPKLMFILAFLELCMVLGNLALACSTNFTCTQFLPTLAYLGCFRGHDRLFIVSCTYYGLVLPLLFLGAHCHFRSVDSDARRLAMLVMGLSICALLPLIALTDEVNGVHILPLESLNSFFCVSFVLLCIIWLALGFSSIRKLTPSLNIHERSWFFRLKVILFTISVLTVTAVVQWHYSYTVYSNAFLNENIEAVCEWLVVSLGIFIPAVFAQFFRNYSLSFSVRSQDRAEFELMKT
jgi:hypothetical protein